MSLSPAGMIGMVAVIAAAVVAMILIVARANMANAKERTRPGLVERSAARSPGLDPAAARAHATKVGDDPTSGDGVEPGGHVVHESGPPPHV